MVSKKKKNKNKCCREHEKVVLTPEQKEKKAEKNRIRKQKRKERNELTMLNCLDSDENFALIIGYTAGGFPYGITWEEMRQIEENERILEIYRRSYEKHYDLQDLTFEEAVYGLYGKLKADPDYESVWWSFDEAGIDPSDFEWDLPDFTKSTGKQKDDDMEGFPFN